MKALDVGSGSGYLTACFAHMVSELLKRILLEVRNFCIKVIRSDNYI